METRGTDRVATNHERGNRLLAGAEDLYRDLKGTLRRGSWNLTVRRAQEVVELTLKGLLSLMGIEYPKVHDAHKRAPAFYFEEEHDEAEAHSAMADARAILKLGRRPAKRLRAQ